MNEFNDFASVLKLFHRIILYGCEFGGFPFTYFLQKLLFNFTLVDWIYLIITQYSHQKISSHCCQSSEEIVSWYA